MFNPDDAALEKLHFSLPRKIFPKAPILPQEQPKNLAGGLVLQTEEETLHHYLDEAETCRRAHGFTWHNGKVYLVDKERVDKLDPFLKEMLRAWVAKKQKAGVWGGTQSP